MFSTWRTRGASRKSHAMDGDIVFVKNIDNIVPRRLKPGHRSLQENPLRLSADLQGRIFKPSGCSTQGRRPRNPGSLGGLLPR